MKIAIAGKGGTGKSTVAALLCRSLVNSGVKPLLAVDADPNSCLPEKLGLEPQRSIGELRETLRAEPEKVPAGISKSEWVESLISQEVAEHIGFDLVVMGRQEGPDCYCYINNLLRHCLEKIGRQYQAVVIDNEAGLEHISRRSNGNIDILLVVTQPTVMGARTAGRIVDLARSLDLHIGASYTLLNGANGELPAAVSAELDKVGLDMLGPIPQDPTVMEFEENCRPLTEMADTSPAAAAVNRIVKTLLERRTA